MQNVTEDQLGQLYKIAWGLVRGFRNYMRWIDSEDLVQVAVSQGCTCLHEWDAKRMSLRDFLRMRMRWVLVDYLRDVSKFRRKQGLKDWEVRCFTDMKESLPDDTLFEEICGGTGIREMPGYLMEVLDELEQAKKNCRLYEREWLILYLRYGMCYSTEDIGKKVGLTEGRVSQILIGLCRRMQLPNMKKQCLRRKVGT